MNKTEEGIAKKQALKIGIDWQNGISEMAYKLPVFNVAIRKCSDEQL